MSFTPPGSGRVSDGEDSAAVLDLANNDALAVAIVDGAGDQVTSFGGGTQYAEDTPHVTGEQVTMAGVVQQAADAALSGDGDRSELQVDSSGFLKVNVKAGSGGGVSHTDDAPFTPGTDAVVPAAGMFDDAAPDSVNEGDAGVLRMSANRNAYVQLRDGTAERSAEVSAANALKVDGSAVTQPVSDAGGSLTVDGTVAVSALPEPVSVDDNGGSLTVDAPLATPVHTRISDGVDVVDVTAAGELEVLATAQPGVDIGDVTVNNGAGAAAVNVQDGGNSLTVDGTVAVSSLPEPVSVDDNGGSLTVDGTVTANQGAAGTAWEMVGDVAADVGVPANPVAVGGRASTAIPTAVSADGDSVYEWLSRQGAPIVAQAPHVGLFGGQPWTLTSETAQYTTTQTSTILVDAGAGDRIVVTAVQIQVGGTTAGTVQLYFGTGAYSRGTSLAIFDGEFAPSATLKPGVIMQGPFIAGANGDDLRVTDSAAINPLTVTVWYYLVT
jgi:hypothetical protein